MSVKALLRSCHPAPTVAVTVLAVALAVAAGREAPGVVLVGVTVLSGQLVIGWANDVLDRERDIASGRADKPVATGAVSARAVGLAALAALAACVPLSLANGLSAGLVHLTIVGSGLGYDLGVKRTLLSWVPFVVAFGLLPAFVALGLPGSPWPPAWALSAAALLGVGAHFANVLPDIEDDLATDVRGLPQRLGARRSRLVAAGLLVAATVVLTVGPPGQVDAIGWVGLAAVAALVAAGFAVRRAAGSRGPFLVAVAVALTAVALLLARGGALS